MLRLAITKMLSVLRRNNGATIEYLRRHGARVGENVKLYNVACGAKDATCLEIGNNVTLTGVRVLTHDASLELFTKEKATKIGRVVIGDNVFVGMGTIILPNVQIGNNVIVGAGSIVSKDIPDNSVVAGNPAKVIGSIDDYIKKHTDNMSDENMFVNVRREDMNDDELRAFNSQIDGRIVYIVDK